MKIRNLFHKAGGLKWPTYGIQRKNKKQIVRKSRETTREEYTLDWSQSKVFLVHNLFPYILLYSLDKLTGK